MNVRSSLGIAAALVTGAVLALAGSALLGAGSATGAGGAAELAPVTIFARSAPGVVDVRVTSVVETFRGTRQVEGEGSGFVLDAKGDVVTNAHVIEGASAIAVVFGGGLRAAASVVGSDTAADLAVLRVRVAASRLHPLALGDSARVRPGESVVAIGSPFGFPGSITAGIVSAVGRTITGPDRSPITGAIQTDAPINSGNSGGPLIDAAGEVIGVNAQIASNSGGNEGVGFAIPSNTVKAVVARLLAG